MKSALKCRENKNRNQIGFDINGKREGRAHYPQQSQTWWRQCDDPGTSLVFVDEGTADRCSRVNSEMYTSILFAHIQTNLIGRDFKHQHLQAWLYVCAVVTPSWDKGGSLAVNVI